MGLGFGRFRVPHMDLFSTVSDTELKTIRQRLINAIMWTDMAKHFDMVAKLDGKIQANHPAAGFAAVAAAVSAVVAAVSAVADGDEAGFTAGAAESKWKSTSIRSYATWHYRRMLPLLLLLLLLLLVLLVVEFLFPPLLLLVV